jgi:hypothetical protein
MIILMVLRFKPDISWVSHLLFAVALDYLFQRLTTTDVFMILSTNLISIDIVLYE